jgi:myo-inositol-1(or 4)-monophosphatase
MAPTPLITKFRERRGLGQSCYNSYHTALFSKGETVCIRPYSFYCECMNSSAPTTELFSDVLTVAKKAASEAARGIVSSRREKNFTLNEKDSRDFVTSSDIEAQRVIEGIIQAAYPSHCILGEEDESLASQSVAAKDLASTEHLWIVDPIDGTTNYMRGHAHVSISIAYCSFGVTKVGLVLAPFLNEEYSAIQGEGARKNGEKIWCAQPRPLVNSLIATGFPYHRDSVAQLSRRVAVILMNCQDLRRNGSAALDLCALADGKVDAYYETDVKPWDIAAGILIARESGVQFGQVQPPPPTYKWCHSPADLQGYDLLGATPEVYERLLMILRDADRIE